MVTSSCSSNKLRTKSLQRERGILASHARGVRALGGSVKTRKKDDMILTPYCRTYAESTGHINTFNYQDVLREFTARRFLSLLPSFKSRNIMQCLEPAARIFAKKRVGATGMFSSFVLYQRMWRIFSGQKHLIYNRRRQLALRVCQRENKRSELNNANYYPLEKETE